MNSNTTVEKNVKQDSQEQKIDLPKLFAKIWASKLLILKVCGIGVVVGLIVALGIPKEYTTETLIIPERTNKGSSSSINALAALAGAGRSSTVGRDAIYPSLYPAVIHSTPFLVRLFDVEVREQKNNTTITLAQYLKEHQKSPWWSVITSAPSRLIGLGMSLFREKEEETKEKTEKQIDLFQLTPEEAGIAGAIASKIKVDVDKKKRTVSISVTMQNPQVAVTVADTVSAHLQAYILEYRTAKVRTLLKYNEELCKEAKEKYYNALKKQAEYADANQHLVMRTSRAELTNLRNETNLALTVYNRLEQQVQLAQARVKEATPVYVVIQPAIMPLAPSKPRMMQILAIYILLAGVGSVGWVLFGKDFLREIRNKKRVAAACGQPEVND